MAPVEVLNPHRIEKERAPRRHGHTIVAKRRPVPGFRTEFEAGRNPRTNGRALTKIGGVERRRRPGPGRVARRTGFRGLGENASGLATTLIRGAGPTPLGVGQSSEVTTRPRPGSGSAFGRA